MTLLRLTLELIVQSQLTQILELDHLCLGGLWTLQAYQKELDSANSTLIAISVPMLEGKVLGYGCFWQILEESHITILAVHPQYHRQGLGQLLLYDLIRRSHLKGLERVTLEVNARNLSALSLYEKFGFKTAGVRKRYYQKNNEDALILWRGDLQQKEFPLYLQTMYQKVKNNLRHHHWQLSEEL